MKLLCLIFLMLLVGCNDYEINVINPLEINLNVDYLKLHNQLQKKLEENNNTFPLLVYKNGINQKKLIYLGEFHGNDPSDKRFDAIEKYIKEFKPQIILNEGGEIDSSIHYQNKEIAIKNQGTLGFLKFCADKKNVKLVNADCSEKTEVAQLLKKYNKDLLIYIFVCQRFIPQFIDHYNKAFDLESEYQKFTKDYLNNRCGFKLSKNESQWSYFERLYKLNNDNKTIDLENFDLNKSQYAAFDKSVLGEISKTSLHIRDSAIVTNIYKNITKYDRVLVVFGALHLIAQKSTLDKIFQNTKTVKYISLE